MIQGIPPNFYFVTPNSLIMLDDLMVEGGNNANVTNLFVKGAHHVPCFVICTSQNIFAKGAENRNRQLNTQYVVCLKILVMCDKFSSWKIKCIHIPNSFW